MSRSSADPEALIGYAASMYNEGQAVLEHLGGTGITEKLNAVRTRCSEYVRGEIPDVAGQVRVATLGAQELDVWVGAVGQGFLLADTSEAAVAQVEDDAVIANLPPGLADPPAETRGKVAEGQRLFDDLMAATGERNHERIEEIMGILEDRQGDTAFMAGFAMKVEELGGIEELKERIEDGMRPKNREGVWGFIVDLGAGAWDAVWGTLEMLHGISIFQLFNDPGQWAENYANLGRGLWQGITNPVEFFKTVIDVEGFLDNPARWLGAFVPDLAATVFSGGAGAALRGVRGLDAIADLAEAARNLDRVADGRHVTDGLSDLSDLSGTVRRLDPDLIGVRDALRQRLIDKGLPSEQADAIANRMASGTQFNRDNWHRYPFNEVRLANGKVLDSYNPDLGEIVSRKNTQLADVQLSTAREYINEAARKYDVGEVIASSPSVLRQEQLTGQRISGQSLRGDIILEVPSQTRGVPTDVLNHARTKGVTIRTTDGVVLTP